MDPTPEPFSTPDSPAPFDPQRADRDGDLRRPLLLGCGVGCSVILALSIVLLIVLGAKMPELLDWVFRVSEDAIATGAPEDWSERDRDRLREAFAAASDAMLAERAEEEAVLALYQRLMDCLQRAAAEGLTRADLEGLEEALWKVAGESSGETALRVEGRGGGELLVAV